MTREEDNSQICTFGKLQAARELVVCQIESLRLQECLRCLRRYHRSRVLRKESVKSEAEVLQALQRLMGLQFRERHAASYGPNRIAVGICCLSLYEIVQE